MDQKIGFDVDVLGGYDFGVVRLEGELAYKRATLRDTKVDVGADQSDHRSVLRRRRRCERSSRAWSTVCSTSATTTAGPAMSAAVSVSPGSSTTRISSSPLLDDLDFSDSDGSVAWQGIAGVRKAISPNMDLGLKYRLLNVSNLDFEEGPGFDLHGRLRSHSLLLSLIYNFSASGSASAAAAAAAAAASAACDADVPGRLGDPGDGRLSGSAAAAAAAAAGAERG